LIDFVFEDALDPNWPRLAVRKLADSLHYIPAFYNFELVERRVEYRWALRTTDDDVRYRLARALLSDEIQTNFDRVLIDAPPRFTLGFVNGFCAATHLYVPTVVDLLSASAVGSFARQFRELRAIVNPRIQWAGIVGTMTFLNPRDTLSLPRTAEDAADAAERAAQNALGTQEKLFIRKPVIVRSADLPRATEKGVAYLNDSDLRPMFDALAVVIEGKAPSRKTRR
jgi:cellulose biosynthesis protein BcsQ